jgi:hypothetical protein
VGYSQPQRKELKEITQRFDNCIVGFVYFLRFVGYSQPQRKEVKKITQRFDNCIVGFV